MKDFSPLAISDAAVGFPARICKITRRTDGVILRIAESDEPVTVEGETYQVIPGIRISAVTHTNNGEMPSCQIVAVHQNGGIINSNDVDIGLFDGAAVQIYIVDRLDLSSKGLLFTGSMAGVSYNIENMITFDVKGPVVNAKIIMTQKRSPMCRTDLFSVLCGLNADDYAVVAHVATLMDAFTFTVTGPTNPDGWFNGGTIINADGVAFEIANWDQSSSRITTYLPSQRLVESGMPLTLYPGCNKTLANCSAYGNTLNFIGEPHFLGTAAAAQQV